MRWIVPMVALAGCPGGPELDVCLPGADPTLQIGLGIGGYEAVPDGGEMPLVHGPQGGWHLEIGLLATHLAADDLITGSMTGEVGGVELASIDPWLDLRCDEKVGGLVSFGTFLIYDTPTSAELDGVETVVIVSLRDLDGTEVDDVRTFVIRDTE